MTLTQPGFAEVSRLARDVGDPDSLQCLPHVAGPGPLPPIGTEKFLPDEFESGFGVRLDAVAEFLVDVTGAWVACDSSLRHRPRRGVERVPANGAADRRQLAFDLLP